MRNPVQNVTWQSTRVVRSKAHPGVEFVIARMSFGRRLELMKRVRDLAARAEFFEAGCDEKNRMEASLLGAEIERLYIEWGVEDIRGLELDGMKATPLLRGPEELVREALEAVRTECGLSEPERKN
jgi:hypothetical protein